MPPVTTQSTDGRIRSTKSYNLFDVISANRDINGAHVEALKKAFAEFGNLTKAQPILVNEKMQIIDGQHRFEAAVALREPVYFTIVPGLSIHDARNMNILHMSWNVNDFAQSYADSGIRAYKDYIELRDKYEVTHSIMLATIGGYTTKGLFRKFREGDLEIPDKEVTEDRLSKLADVREITPVTRAMAYALMHMFEHPKYDHARFLRKLTQNEVYKPFSTVGDNLRAFEDIYNYMYSEENRVRFF